VGGKEQDGGGIGRRGGKGGEERGRGVRERLGKEGGKWRVRVLVRRLASCVKGGAKGGD